MVFRLRRTKKMLRRQTRDDLPPTTIVKKWSREREKACGYNRDFAKQASRTANCLVNFTTNVS